jgi:hypothetical protein
VSYIYIYIISQPSSAFLHPSARPPRGCVCVCVCMCARKKKNERPLAISARRMRVAAPLRASETDAWGPQRRDRRCQAAIRLLLLDAARCALAFYYLLCATRGGTRQRLDIACVLLAVATLLATTARYHSAESERTYTYLYICIYIYTYVCI